MYRPPGEARNTATAAMSGGFAMKPPVVQQLDGYDPVDDDFIAAVVEVGMELTDQTTTEQTP